MAAGGAEGTADQPQPQEHEQEQLRAGGKGLSRSGSVLDESSTSRGGGGGGGGRDRQRESGCRKGDEESGEVDGSSDCGGMRDERVGTDATNADTDSLPASTPAASPGPSSPVPTVPLEEQPHLQGGGGGGGSSSAGAGDVAATATTTATTDVVAPIGTDQAAAGDQGEEEAQREEGPAPFDGLDLSVEVTTATSGSVRMAPSDEARKAPPETETAAATGVYFFFHLRLL